MPWPLRRAGNYVTYLKPLMGMKNVTAARIERKQITDIRNAMAQARGNGAATGVVRRPLPCSAGGWTTAT